MKYPHLATLMEIGILLSLAAVCLLYTNLCHINTLHILLNNTKVKEILKYFLQML